MEKYIFTILNVSFSGKRSPVKCGPHKWLDVVDFAGDWPRACWILLEVLECYLEVAGAYWMFLEVLEQAHNELL